MSEADKIYEYEIVKARKEAKEELSFMEKLKYKFSGDIKAKVEERADEIAKEKTRWRVVNMSLGHMARQSSRQQAVDRACGLRRF